MCWNGFLKGGCGFLRGNTGLVWKGRRPPNLSNQQAEPPLNRSSGESSGEVLNPTLEPLVANQTGKTMIAG
ncbi:MAG: hypothetical protein KDI30_11875 [Pseudomonadales bacterium]|nr:hypothetical protein [Pseudomonadales bacterium]